ncbi:unnamed protein product [Acanthosepion pharaonis]|uniref:Uncharacterized protein n=1 Tax=Acanthosepion pharaonis TaxID=158019 RepID=A0A812DKN8_ACAPH|nr:unnamed protein product [Sepia pharaonis]
MLEMELPSSCTGSESDKERGGEELLLRPLCNGVLISVGADVDDKDGGGDTSLVVSWRNEVFLELLSKDFRFFKPPNLPFPFFTGAISVEGCCLFKSFSGEADSAPESQRSASTSLCFLVSSSASKYRQINVISLSLSLSLYLSIYLTCGNLSIYLIYLSRLWNSLSSSCFLAQIQASKI